LYISMHDYQTFSTAPHFPFGRSHNAVSTAAAAPRTRSTWIERLPACRTAAESLNGGLRGDDGLERVCGRFWCSPGKGQRFFIYFYPIFGRRRVKTERHAQPPQTCSAVGFEHNFEYNFSGRTKGWRKGRRVNRK
jgi:hypothetical protein